VRADFEYTLKVAPGLHEDQHANCNSGRREISPEVQTLNELLILLIYQSMEETI